MHVNDANPVELIAQSDSAQKFWIINRQTMIGKCYDIRDYLTRQQNAITITIAAFIDAGNILFCYLTFLQNLSIKIMKQKLLDATNQCNQI
jgi:hypothetical protein